MNDQSQPVRETITLTPAQAKIRKRRGQYLALALFGFVILVFVITLARLGDNAAAVAKSRDFSSAVEYYSADGEKLDAAGNVIEDAPEDTEMHDEGAQ
ncbi:hypothetical protein [Hirschia litorea]|uniref:Uncharacterized protein n=1 Tax=Hirschia litorea TaxID=1199156 RepID=A0ABW2IIW0_9PROT